MIYEFNLSKQPNFSKVISEGFTESMDNRCNIARENVGEAVTPSCGDPGSNTHNDFALRSTYSSAEVEQLKFLRILDLVTDFRMRSVDVTATKRFNLLSNHHYLKETGALFMRRIHRVENSLANLFLGPH